MAHYCALLELRPESYWGNYRAAVVSYALGSFAATARYLEKCLERRPGNAALRGQRAACLAWLARYPEAIEECNRALAAEPDLAELFRTRAFTRLGWAQLGGLTEDIHRFEVLSRRLPPAFWGNSPASTELALAPLQLPRIEPSGRFNAESTSDEPAFDDPLNAPGAADPDEIDARAVLADTILRSGEREVGSVELDKILLLDPDHFAARMSRALVAIEMRRFDEAARDLDLIVNHGGLFQYCLKDPTFILRFHEAARAYEFQRKPALAKAIAGKALEFADREADRDITRVARALLEIDVERSDLALQRLGALFADPKLPDRVDESPALLNHFHEVTHALLRHDQVKQACEFARKTLDLVIKLRRHSAESHFNLARAYAVAGRTDRAMIVEAADQLYHATASNREFDDKYRRSPAFDAVRDQIAPVLAQMPEIHRLPDPDGESRRRFLASSSRVP